MKKAVLFATLFSFLAFVKTSSAEDSTLYPIKQGEISPFEGLLLTPTAVATIIADRKLEAQKNKLSIERCEERAKLGIENCSSEAKLSERRQLAIYEKEKTDLNTTITALQIDIKKKDELLSKGSSNGYYFLGGVALGISTALLTTYVISNASH